MELAKHIEILLLWNDCVIVPGLGGFTASHIPARYDKADGMFIPPLRTLGFNHKLNVNDSLLAQSYTETYDISYPEALKRIAEEVDELKQHISNNGTYTLNDIGTLHLTDNGIIGFTPCEAGVLTPDLYSLSSFEMKKPGENTISANKDTRKTTTETKQAATVKAEIAPLTQPEDRPATKQPKTVFDGDKTISIKLSVLRNAAAVIIAIIGFFLLSSPLNNSRNTVQMSQAEYGLMSKLVNSYNNNTTKAPVTLLSKAADTKKAPTKVNVDTEKTEPLQPKAVESYFCIVLASRVATKNAKEFVSKLARNGYADAHVLTEKSHSTKVIYGNYKTRTEAYNALNDLGGSEIFQDAWVYQVKN